MVSRPTDPAPLTRTRSFVADPGGQRRVDGAGHRLDQDRLLVGVALRHGVELAAMGDQLLAPPAAGVRAEAGLQAGGEVADGDPVAAVGGTRSQQAVAGVDAPGGAGEHRVDDDAGARRQVLAVVDQLGDHLVAGDERHRDHRGEVEAGASRQRPEVGAADARQPGPQPRPAGPVDPRLVDRHQPQRRGEAGQHAGHPAADHACRPRAGAASGTSRARASSARHLPG